MERRQQLHERTGAAPERLYSAAVEEHLAELVHHYDCSANPDQAGEVSDAAGNRHSIAGFRRGASAIANYGFGSGLRNWRNRRSATRASLS